MKRLSLPFSFLEVSALTLAAVLLCAPCARAATESILHSFHTTLRGQYPGGGLISDSAGNLYGTTEDGGDYDYGTVFMLSPNSNAGWTQTVLYSFKGFFNGSTDGYYPTGALSLDTAGNLYGATTWGGNGLYGAGTVFQLTHSNGKWQENILWNFQQSNPEDGFNPQGGLAFDSSGNLYGTAKYGGGFSQSDCSFDGGCGIVFQLSPRAGKWDESILYVFQGLSDGEYPNDGLAIDAAGNLYGTTRSNYNSNGVVFELAPAKNGIWAESTLYTFTGGADGLGPSSGLIFDRSGNLDGVTSQGGAGTACSGYPCGTVFQLTPASHGAWTEKVLFSFNGTDGQSPQGKLLLDQQGNLYGTTAYGGTAGLAGYEGTVFKLTPTAGEPWNENVLWNFANASDGANPAFGVIAGPAGQLYGANSPSLGSSAGNGVIFQLTSSQGKWKETTLNSFPDADGGLPQASLIADSSGNLYGTTSQGGSYGYGTVFKLTNSPGWPQTTLYNFPTGATDGPYKYSNPSTLIFDSDGNLYGETEYGGASQLGTVFELSPNSSGQWQEKILFTFAGVKTGIDPLGGLAFDSAGNLYGSAQAGGSSHPGCQMGCGLIFKLTPLHDSWHETVLYNFVGGTDGAVPSTGVIFDNAGNLYGATQKGGGLKGIGCFGGNGCGTIFKLTPTSSGLWNESLIHVFPQTLGDGVVPQGIISDQSGNLYGATTYGGSSSGSCGAEGCGAVFELSPQSTSWTESILYAFPNTNGASYPAANLTLDSAGNLYGPAQRGTYGQWGSVFELTPGPSASWNEITLYSFPEPGGGGAYSPEAALLLAPSGTIYGTTAGGGAGNWGTVFQIVP